MVGNSEPILYVAPTPAGDSGSQTASPTYEKPTIAVDPTEAHTMQKPTPDSKRGWPHGSISIALPRECVPVRVGDRMVYSPPANLGPVEVSEWNRLQFDIQARAEAWRVLDVVSPPDGAGLDVGSSEVTREQLRAVVAGQGYYKDQEAAARYLMDRAVWEQRLGNLIWQSEYARLDRAIATAEAENRRVVTARERLLREAPAELHARVTELKAAKRLAERELDEKGQDNGDKIGWLRETVARLKRAPALDHGQAYDLAKYERELSERTSKLEAAAAELAEIEAKMLEA